MSTIPTTPSPVVPANVEAEEAVLGSILIDPNAILRVAPRLRPEDFYVERHAWVYDAMLKLQDRGEAIDVLTLAEQLRRDGRLDDIGGLSFLAALANRVPTSIHVEYYAGLVEEAAIRRQLAEAAQEIARMAYRGEDDLTDIIDHAQQLIFAVSAGRERRDLRPLGEAMQNLLDHLEAIQASEGEVLGVPTGLRLLDKILGSMQKSDLILLAARPGMGKTSLALNIALNAALRLHKHVAFFSLEMSAEQLALRLLSIQANIDSQKLRKGQLTEEEWRRLLDAAATLAETEFYVDDTPAASVMEVRSKARRLHSEARIDLVIIDYLQLMRSDRRVENRVQEISYISRSLKALARELDVPLVALSQLSRSVEQRHNKRPILSDLRESGSLEQDADVVLFLYSEDYYQEKEKQDEEKAPAPSDKPNIVEIRVAKHRHGPTGTINVYFDKAHTRFYDLEMQKEPINQYA